VLVCIQMHFQRDHFLCEDKGCLEKKFVVFESEAELKASEYSCAHHLLEMSPFYFLSCLCLVDLSFNSLIPSRGIMVWNTGSTCLVLLTVARRPCKMALQL
jgi:hypothetical protein